MSFEEIGSDPGRRFKREEFDISRELLFPLRAFSYSMPPMSLFPTSSGIVLYDIMFSWESKMVTESTFKPSVVLRTTVSSILNWDGFLRAISL